MSRIFEGPLEDPNPTSIQLARAEANVKEAGALLADTLDLTRACRADYLEADEQNAATREPPTR